MEAFFPFMQGYGTHSTTTTLNVPAPFPVYNNATVYITNPVCKFLLPLSAMELTDQVETIARSVKMAFD